MLGRHLRERIGVCADRHPAKDAAGESIQRRARCSEKGQTDRRTAAQDDGEDGEPERYDGVAPGGRRHLKSRREKMTTASVSSAAM